MEWKINPFRVGAVLLFLCVTVYHENKTIIVSSHSIWNSYYIRADMDNVFYIILISHNALTKVQ